MTINARRVAIEGIGFGVLAVATMGLLGVEQVQPQPSPPSPEHVETRIVRGGGGGGAGLSGRAGRKRIEINWDTFWLDEAERKAKERAEREADYAILPLTDAINVVALADGVVDTFVDEKGGLVVRLTAEDGTVYYYAKVRSAREGRVRKGDSIGVSVGASIAPKALPAAAKDETPRAAEPQPAVYGVLPIAPAAEVAARTEPLPALPTAMPPQEPRAELARMRTFSASQAITIGAMFIGLALSVAWLLQLTQREAAPKKKKRRRRRHR